MLSYFYVFVWKLLELRVLTRRMNERTALHDVSQLLDTGLDKETLSILVSLCEMGVNPEALANIVKELRQLKEETTPSVQQ